MQKYLSQLQIIIYYFAGLGEDVETEEAMEKTEVIPWEWRFKTLFCLKLYQERRCIEVIFNDKERDFCLSKTLERKDHGSGIYLHLDECVKMNKMCGTFVFS